MMRVMVISFGSSWWARFGRDPRDRYRFTRHAAYFNSTGLCSGRKVRRYWIVPGLLRFNGVGDFNPQFPNRSIGSTFECADLTFACGGNRLLFLRKIRKCPLPDYFLLVVTSERCGAFDCRNSGWKSETVLPIAVSQHRDRAEALLLMRPGDWVKTSLGIWQLTVVDRKNHATLTLTEVEV
jgi:hypothetical protein